MQRPLSAALHRGFGCDWEPHEDGRAAARSCIDVERGATQTSALTHADQPKAAILRAVGDLRRIEAAAVILDDEE